MKNLNLILVALFVCSLFFILPNVMAVEVAEDCWMEQKMCSWSGCWWEKGNCEVEPEWWQGEDEWCRVECSYVDVSEFNEEDYYTKDDINNMFDDMYHYIRCNYVKKSVVNILFWKHYKLVKRVEGVEGYISEHEEGWSKDIVGGGGGIGRETVTKMIEDAIAWLTGAEKSVDELSERIAVALSSYFVNWNEYYSLKEKVTVMQGFMEEKYGSEFCDYEAYRLIEEFDWEKVECGGTTYYPKEDGGVLGITPV